jgi:hypothetical protein
MNHVDLGKYLNANEGYLAKSYLAAKRAAYLGMQVEQLTNTQIGMQVEEPFYNTTQLRFLCDFASRGYSGNNWTASPTTTATDFQPKNLNTDIVEQRYQSNDGVTTVTLICDTEVSQGIFADTFAMLNHNLSRGATVEVSGADDIAFSTLNTSFNFDITSDNSYYIPNALPIKASRYWRFVIQDPFNSDGYIAIGVIVFGRSTLLSTNNNFIDPLEFGYRHFKDSNPIEAYTSVSNDRATRRSLTLRFENMNAGSDDFQSILNMILESKTSLKCLIIPTPDYPELFAVFAKLVELPRFSHTKHSEGTDQSAHYVNFDLNWDEAL